MRVAAVESLGLRTVTFVYHLGRITIFLAEIARCFLLGPRRFRRFVNEVFDIGVLSLAVVCLSGAVVGGVLALQGYFTLTDFGAEGQLGAVVAHSLIRELGPVLTALLVTGRAGSAMAAEIAAMVRTEQLDGLRMMSIDPVNFVVTPKVLAMLVAMPLLVGLFIVFGLLGGYLAGVQQLGLDGGYYLSSMESTIEFGLEVAGGLVKAVIFGALVGLVATYRGYIAEPTAAGVSAATTETVVVGSVSILLFDFAITSLWGT